MKAKRLVGKVIAAATACAMIVTSVPLNVFAADETTDGDAWTATPYTREDGTVVEGLEEAIQGKEHWLETTKNSPAEARIEGDILTISNGIITRKFKVPGKGETGFYTQSYKNEYVEKELLEEEPTPEVYLGLYDETYDEIYDDSGIKVTNDPIASMDNKLEIPEGAIKIDPDYFCIGGKGTKENTFIFDGYTIKEDCEAAFEWTPNEKYGEAGKKMPEGVRVEFDFSASDAFPEVYQGITVKVIYEMYDSMPAMLKRVEVTNSGEQEILIGRMAPEILNGNADMDDLLLLENTYLCGDQSALPVGRELPCRCEMEKENSPFKGLTEMNHTCYDVGPAYDLAKDQTFVSFDTYEMVFSTYWFELQMRERMGMYRNLFPWITDNPLTFHNVQALTKEKIDHAAEAGFDMIIQSYSAPDQSNQMLSRDQATLDKYKELVDYAHSKGIDIGIYQAQYTRGQYSGDYSYGNNDVGQWDIWCVASAAFDDYWDNFKYFVKYTGLDAVEIDGAYPGTYCNHGHDHVNADKETDPDPEGTDKETGDESKYAVHQGFFDSNVKQWENAVRMLCKEFRNMGVYIKVPAWYYLNGSNKCGIGYEEAAWSQPRHEQLIYGRQIMHNASYARSMSMSWSHVPFSNYHGGGSAAAFQPFSDHMEDYNWVMAQYLGNGVASDFRGNALFDEGTQDICNKWVDFYHRYRGIVDSDMVHISQATYDESDRTRGIKMDTLYHVNAKNDGEKGLLWVYNQTDEERTETITVPMYYTGLTNLNYPPVPVKGSLGKDVHKYGAYPPNYSWIPAEEGNYQFPETTGEITGSAAFVREGVKVENLEIDSNGNAQLTVTLPPMSFTYYTIYDENEVPEVELEIGKVTGVTSENVTEASVDLMWNKEVDVTLKENGVVNENPAVTIDGYNVYRNGEKVATTMTNSYQDTGVEEDSEYTYTITAIVSGTEGKHSDTTAVNTKRDETAPEIASVRVVSDTEIQVEFTEEVDVETAENLANYGLNNEGKVSAAKMEENAENRIVVLTVEPLKPMVNYELTIANVKDISKAGNVMETVTQNLIYGYIVHYAVDSVDNDVLIADNGGQNAKTSNVNYTEGTGKNGSAIFNASYHAYADLGVSPVSGMDTYSISMFVRPTDLNGKQALLSAGQEEVSENEFGLYMEDGKLVFRTSNTDGNVKVELISEELLTADKWNQVVITREGNLFKLYLNGKNVAETQMEGIGTYESLNTLYLGAMTNHAGGDRTAFFDGKMDEISLYNVALSEEGIAKESSSYLGRYDNAKPIVYLDMNQVEEDGAIINKADGKRFTFNGPVEIVEGDNGIKGLRFNGSDNYINLGNEYQLDGEFTVSAWVNVATTGDNRNHKIFGRGHTGSAAGEFYIAVRNSGYNVDFKNTDGSNGGSLFDFNGVNYVPKDQWTQLVVTCDGDTIKVYNNGTLHGKTGNASGLNLAGNEKELLVGAGWNGSGTGLQKDHIFNGAMDEVYLYDTVLSESEIQALQTPGNVNKDALQDLYDEKKDIVNDNYTDTSWAAFEEALTQAKNTLEKADVTQWEIDDAFYALTDAANGLVQNEEPEDTKPVSKKTLEYFLNKAKEHVANGDVDGCVDSIQKLFEEAIAEGEAVMAKEDATKEEVNAATTKLVDAIHALEMLEGDKTDLEMALELANSFDLTKYVEKGQAEFLAAKKTAEEVLANGDAMQKEVDAAWDALVETISQLRLKADKSALEELLESVKGLSLEKYTEQSVAVFRTALAKAQEVMADESLSEKEQKTVDDAVKALADAKDGLKLKDGENTENPDGDHNNNGGTGNDNGGNNNAGDKDNKKSEPIKDKNAPKTGDAGSMTMAMLAMLLAGGTIVTLKKRKEE